MNLSLFPWMLTLKVASYEYPPPFPHYNSLEMARDLTTLLPPIRKITNLSLCEHEHGLSWLILKSLFTVHANFSILY